MSEYYECVADVTPEFKLETNRIAWRRHLAPFVGKRVVVRVGYPPRGRQRNNKLHAVFAEVAAALGWEADEFKEFIVTKLRPLGEDPGTGYLRRQRTHKMSDEEIDQLVLEIKAWTSHQMPGFVFKHDAEEQPA